ncbi:MAG: hypothetical protein WC833_08680 [Bacteroidales bacterium]|jgi:hypothetical protein
MDTIYDALKSITSYPVPALTIRMICRVRGLDTNAEFTTETYNTKSYQLALADLMMWISKAPNVSENDVDFNMLVTDREVMRAKAQTIYRDWGDSAYQAESKVKYGYKGDSL